MLALLLVVVLAAIGCVLWFMREAVANERLAVRQRLSDAYQGQLAFVQRRVEEQWQHQLARFGAELPAPELFARAVEEGWADSVVCLDENGQVVYPRTPRPSVGESGEGETEQRELRTLVQAGRTDDAVRWVLERFATEGTAPLTDAQGRLVAPSAELLALQILGNSADERFRPIAQRLERRLNDYSSSAMSSSQRLFLMRELQRLAGDVQFSTMGAEELAIRFAEAHPQPILVNGLRPSELPGIWQAAAPGRRGIALFQLATVRAALNGAAQDPSLPPGVRITAIPPGEDALTGATLVTAPLGASLPGWRLSLALNDRAIFDTTADRKVVTYLWIASGVIGLMTVLAVFVAGGFRRQMQLARLKNDLVATVSHELKTPLTAMRALVDTLVDAEKFDEANVREYLGLLARENARLSRLIDNFLTFSRLERNKFTFTFTRLLPRNVAENAVAALGERANAPDCQLEVQAPAGLPEIVGDADALVTALLNLLDNACKYSPNEKRIALRVAAQNGSVEFAVEDHGIGLSPAERQRIFQRFYQVDQRLARTAGGCGLGLSIVQSIAVAHGGTIRVESEPGRGSTFTLGIPIAGEVTA